MENFIVAIRRHSNANATVTNLSAGEELNQAIKLLEYHARKKDTTLQLSGSHAMAQPAPPDFYKIAYNLLSYSIDAVASSPAVIQVELSRQANNLILKISYPAEIMPTLSAADSTGDENLGLAIVKNFLEKNGGSFIAGAEGNLVILEASWPD